MLKLDRKTLSEFFTTRNLLSPLSLLINCTSFKVRLRILEMLVLTVVALYSI